jgi:tetratricopeptide (TPR) repeat protein
MPRVHRRASRNGFVLIEWLITVAALLLIGVRVPERPMPPSAWVGKIAFVRINGTIMDTSAEPRSQVPKDGASVLADSIWYRVNVERARHVQVRTRQGVNGWLRKDQVVLLDVERANYLQVKALPGAPPLEDAVTFFTKRLEANPKDTDALNRRAAALRAKGELDAAIRDASEGIRFNPRSPVMYNNRAIIYHAKKDYDKAIADYAQAIALNPKYTLAYSNRAVMWHGKKDYDQAIADATKALELEPKTPVALRIRGISWHEKKEYDKAIDDLTQMLRMDPKSAQAHADRAHAWARKKEYTKAHADYNEARRLDVGQSAALAFWLASCPEAKYRDGNRALELAKQAHQRDRNNAKAIEALAAAHAELGRFDDAIRWQEQALQHASVKDDTAAHRRLEMYRAKQVFRQD